MNSIQDENGTPFSVLMNQAVRLKNAQLASSRSHFDKFPTYYQNSLFQPSGLVALRSTFSFEGRLNGANKLKEDGNTAYYNSEYDNAIQKYEMALSVFRYIENLNEDWKSKGIRDEDIIEINNVGDTDREKQQIASFLLSCYGNLALVLLKCRDYRTAIDACNESLRIDSQSVKALYLRARATIEPSSAGAVEQDAALADLLEANRIDPNNKKVRATLRHLRESTRRQKTQDKIAFGGLFDRGTIYGDRKDGQEEGAARNRNMSAAQAKDLVTALSASGKEAEADAVRKAIENASSQPTTIDFRKPNQQMMKDAESRGVDLADERVVTMLEDMQQSNQDGQPKSAEVQYTSANECAPTSSLSTLCRMSGYFHLLHVEPRHLVLGFVAYVAMQCIRYWR